ncbi:DNA repair helicase, partial [Lactobacillus sp. XV13L]|nr:DNA repair helicase [Lactobacillus sp. XV13L]
YTYSLEDAIKNHFLAQYDYKPIITPFTEQEMDDFEYYSERIGTMIDDQSNKQVKEELQFLLIKRANIIKHAQSKKQLLEQVIMQQSDHHFTLIYCSDKKEITQVLQMLHRHQITCQRFDSDVPKLQRQKILRQFAQGLIEVLVAVKCLDEGVDVPATKEAFFLASTTNPREFIQRRGRILRTANHKVKAILHDFVVFPPVNYQGSAVESLIRHELPRVFDLNEYALNKFSARQILLPALRDLGLESYLDNSP